MYLEMLRYHLDSEEGKKDFIDKVLKKAIWLDDRINDVYDYTKDISFTDKNVDYEYRMKITSSVLRVVYKSILFHSVATLSSGDESIVFNDYECLSVYAIALKPKVSEIYREYMSAIFGDEYIRDYEAYILRKADEQSYYESLDDTENNTEEVL